MEHFLLRPAIQNTTVQNPRALAQVPFVLAAPAGLAYCASFCLRLYSRQKIRHDCHIPVLSLSIQRLCKWVSSQAFHPTFHEQSFCPKHTSQITLKSFTPPHWCWAQRQGKGSTQFLCLYNYLLKINVYCLSTTCKQLCIFGRSVLVWTYFACCIARSALLFNLWKHLKQSWNSKGCKPAKIND